MRRALALLPIAVVAACSDRAPTVETITAENMTEAHRRSAPDGKPLRDAIVAHLGTELSEDALFTVAWSDLNGDGKDEAIVYLRDSTVCGSGGCNTYVLQQTAPDAWRVVSDISVSRPPIYRLPPGEDGWAQLGVTVAGGGLMQMVMAVPHIDGAYASNPTVAPARPIDPGDSEVLIPREAVRPSSDG